MNRQERVLRNYILSEVYNIEKDSFLKENNYDALPEGLLLEGLLAEGRLWDWTKNLYKKVKSNFELSPEENDGFDEMVKQARAAGKNKRAKEIDELRNSIVAKRFRNQNILILGVIATTIFQLTGDFNIVKKALNDPKARGINTNDPQVARAETRDLMTQYIPNFDELDYELKQKTNPLPEILKVLFQQAEKNEIEERERLKQQRRAEQEALLKANKEERKKRMQSLEAKMFQEHDSFSHIIDISSCDYNMNDYESIRTQNISYEDLSDDQQQLIDDIRERVVNLNRERLANASEEEIDNIASFKYDLESINKKVNDPDLNDFIEEFNKVQRVKGFIAGLKSVGRGDEIDTLDQYIDFDKHDSLASEYYDNQINGDNN